jgi:hypothetical protein
LPAGLGGLLARCGRVLESEWNFVVMADDLLHCIFTRRESEQASGLKVENGFPETG